MVASDSEKLKQRRRQVIVHSCLYYEFDTPVISDEKFDSFCKDVIDLQSKLPNYSDEFDRYFEGFDGSTGMHLAGYELVCRFSKEIHNLLKTAGADLNSLRIQFTPPKIAKRKSK